MCTGGGRTWLHPVPALPTHELSVKTPGGAGGVAILGVRGRGEGVQEGDWSRVTATTPSSPRLCLHVAAHSLGNVGSDSCPLNAAPHRARSIRPCEPKEGHHEHPEHPETPLGPFFRPKGTERVPWGIQLFASAHCKTHGTPQPETPHSASPKNCPAHQASFIYKWNFLAEQPRVGQIK